MHGQGVATYANGDVYEGAFAQGRRSGQGVMRYATGQVEDGEWREGAFVPAGAEAPSEPASPDEAAVAGPAEEPAAD
jgi:hypothetical protein